MDVLTEKSGPRSAATAAPVWDSPPQKKNDRLELTRLPWLRVLVVSRWPQFLIRAVTLAGFVFTILAGLLGTPVGSHNFAIIFVWIAWWTALKLAFIPFGGRSWCSVCPIPLPGEWLQQGQILGRAGRSLGLLKKWPKSLRGYWLQGSGFLLIGLFSAVTLTDPGLTSWVLLGLFGLAIALSLVFEKRAFCSYLCPIGGFTGLYTQMAPLEVRVKDVEICKAHTEKSCYTACSWGIYPVALRNSAQCGLCMECLRACPSNNLAFNLRPFGADLSEPRRHARLDEAFMALVMLGSVIAFSAVFLGPWGALKSAAYAIGSPAWLVYVVAFLALNLVLLPGLFFLAVWLGERRTAAIGKVQEGRKRFFRAAANSALSLLPLGLFAWIAFTISFAFPKFSYVLSVLSDPVGWGWNLFGSANSTGTADLGFFGVFLQGGLLLVGLVWAARTALDNVEKNVSEASPERAPWIKALPLLAFHLAFTLVMIWLLVA